VADFIPLVEGVAEGLRDVAGGTLGFVLLNKEAVQFVGDGVGDLVVAEHFQQAAGSAPGVPVEVTGAGDRVAARCLRKVAMKSAASGMVDWSSSRSERPSLN
jgi:hypothetical protein